MSASVIDRFSNAAPSYGGVTLPNKRNEMMERISRNCRVLRPAPGANGVVDLLAKGRNDSLEQLLVRLGVIPIATLPNTTSLTGTIQTWAARRPAGTEFASVTGPTAPTAFTSATGAIPSAFTAGGANQVLAANDSVDAAAKGRALITIAP